MRKSITRALLITAFLLLIPFVVMQFTDEVNWSAFDFVVAGVFFAIAAFSFELVARKPLKRVYYTALAVGLLGALLLFIVNGAVGIIGSENEPANLLYGAVLLVLLLGSLLARFKPQGMANTLFTAGGVQLLVPVVALFFWPPSVVAWLPSVFGVFALSGLFAVVFAVSGLLFRRAASVDHEQKKTFPN